MLSYSTTPCSIILNDLALLCSFAPLLSLPPHTRLSLWHFLTRPSLPPDPCSVPPGWHLPNTYFFSILQSLQQGPLGPQLHDSQRCSWMLPPNCHLLSPPILHVLAKHSFMILSPSLLLDPLSAAAFMNPSATLSLYHLHIYTILSPSLHSVLYLLHSPTPLSSPSFCWLITQKDTRDLFGLRSLRRSNALLQRERGSDKKRNHVFQMYRFLKQILIIITKISSVDKMSKKQF